MNILKKYCDGKILKIFNQHRYGILLAFLAFLFMNVLVTVVPIFWEGHLFHEANLREDVWHWLKIAVNPYKEDVYSSSGGITRVWIWILFSFWKYNFNFWRYTKSIFFALSVFFVYLLAKRFLNEEKYGIYAATTYLFLFPLYVHVLVFDGPFIVAEAAKLLALIIFFHDVEREKTSFVSQALIFLFVWIAVNTYTQMLSVVGTLFLTCIFIGRGKMKRYGILLLLLFTIRIGNVFDVNLGKATELAMPSHWDIITSMFLGGFRIASQEFIPSLHTLYYKTFWEIVTPYGIIILFISIAIIIIKNVSFLKQENNLILFCFFWLLSEFPLWLLLPEPAIRYTSPLFPPFLLLFFFVIKKAGDTINQQSCRKLFGYGVLLLLFFMITTNVLYSVIFRATWGSAFIAEGKALSFIEEVREPNAVVLHYQPSVAEIFVAIDISNTSVYAQKKDVVYLPINNFSDSSLRAYAENYTETYVVQRITSTGKKFPPTYNLSDSKILVLYTVIYGTEETLFDRLIFSPLTSTLIVPNKILVYKL